MKALTEREYRQNAEPALRKIFLDDDPRLTEFGESAESVKLLYEYIPPEDEITKSLLSIASSMGNDGFFFSNLSRNKTDTTVMEHWWVPFDELDLYLSRRKDVFGDIYQLENVVYAPDGTWGIISSFEQFGLLAGTQNYIDKCADALPTVEQGMERFLTYIQEYMEADPDATFPWLEDFISRIEKRQKQ